MLELTKNASAAFCECICVQASAEVVQASQMASIEAPTDRLALTVASGCAEQPRPVMFLGGASATPECNMSQISAHIAEHAVCQQRYAHVLGQLQPPAMFDVTGRRVGSGGKRKIRSRKANRKRRCAEAQ